MRHLGDEPLPLPATAVAACHIGLGPGLVDEHETFGAFLKKTAARTVDDLWDATATGIDTLTLRNAKNSSPPQDMTVNHRNML